MKTRSDIEFPPLPIMVTIIDQTEFVCGGKVFTITQHDERYVFIQMRGCRPNVPVPRPVMELVVTGHSMNNSWKKFAREVWNNIQP